MTPEQQRIAIAEWCGWRHGEVKPSKWFPDGGTGWIGPQGLGCLPDYLNDLNAMHEAESKLSYEQLREYVNNLALVHMQTLNRNDWDYVGFVHIPANERAEALLGTIGKWKD